MSRAATPGKGAGTSASGPSEAAAGGRTSASAGSTVSAAAPNLSPGTPAAAARVRRSVLFVPGNRPDRIPKAFASGADTVVVDLEDAVPLGEKPAARRATAQEVGRHIDARGPLNGTPEVAVRINSLETDLWIADLEAILPSRPDGIVVPKAERPEAIRELDVLIHRMEPEGGKGRTKLLLILETAMGVLKAEGLAQASPRVEALLFGAEDLTASIGARRTSDSLEVLHARSQVVLVAAAYGKYPIDQVFLDYKNPDGLLKDAVQGRNLGYRGKQIIHPGQIEPLHKAFSPTQREIDEARRIMQLVERSGIEDGGVVGYEGVMLDKPVIERAKRVLAEAEQAGLI